MLPRLSPLLALRCTVYTFVQSAYLNLPTCLPAFYSAECLLLCFFLCFSVQLASVSDPYPDPWAIRIRIY
jgi:hypothetical protein